MTVDIKSILIKQFVSIFENNFNLIMIIFIAAMVVFVFRHNIVFYFNLSRREQNKLVEITLMPLIFIFIGSMLYLYVQQYFFLLSIGLSVIVAYFLYIIGILDVLIEKLGDRYVR